MTEEQTPRADPLLGQVLAERYRLTRKIGEGGMGTVYEATHVVLGKSVAVKVLREKYLDRRSVAQRLVQEARHASAIRHDHIIDITDSGATDDGRTFVVMELIDGQSLAELLKREGALPEARALAIVRQVVSALGAAHARGIVHRDVKPENILLRAGSDFVKVVDFGISKMVRPEDAEAEALEIGRLTSTGMVLGTPFYMAPEQARGDEEFDHRIDIYAVGVILYECLTGEVPFRGPNYLGILARVAAGDATPPRTLMPELSISEGVERVVMKAMSKERDARYATMEELAADIDAVVAGRAIDAPAPLGTPVRGRGRLVAGVVAAAVVLAVGLPVALWPRRPPPVTRVEPPKPPPVETPKLPKSTTVVVHFDINSDPPGAEVRDGKKLYGKTPTRLDLERSGETVHLDLSLDGYVPAQLQVRPLADEKMTVTLQSKQRPKPIKRTRPAAPTANKAAEPKPAPRGETLPNPYAKP
jgi:eukaryotic-like serine/threonine-protein kinase